jgi:hypothetical protein
MASTQSKYLRLSSTQHAEILNKQILQLEVQRAETEADLARLEELPEEIRDPSHTDQVRELRRRIAQLASGIATTADRVDAISADGSGPGVPAEPGS